MKSQITRRSFLSSAAVAGAAAVATPALAASTSANALLPSGIRKLTWLSSVAAVPV